MIVVGMRPAELYHTCHLLTKMVLHSPGTGDMSVSQLETSLQAGPHNNSERQASEKWASVDGAGTGDYTRSQQRTTQETSEGTAGMMARLLQALRERTWTIPVCQHLQGLWKRYVGGTAIGRVRFGSLRRLTPIGEVFGLKRGQSLDLCIDRYYIEHFLAHHASDIHGRVLEIAENTYTRRFGGARVLQSDVLHAAPGNPDATMVADLTHAEHLAANAFDCIILTQTLQYIYDLRAAMCTLHRSLKPGGVLLATCPGISQTSRYDADNWGEFWRFTTLSARRLCTEVFPNDGVTVQAYGNVLVATAFLYGLILPELRRDELEYHDPDYELLITIRAVKPYDEP
jgi:SAM-dependent methyltransferase